MPRLRENYDWDRIARHRMVEYRTSTNRFELPCSVCGKTLFVDEETKEDFDRAARQDLDYNLTCLDCEQEYDGLAYE